MSDVPLPTWRKSSYSGAGKECVEVADSAAGALVRDSKQPELGHLTFPSTGWNTFLSSLKAPPQQLSFPYGDPRTPGGRA